MMMKDDDGGHGRLCVCLSVCVPVPRRMSTLRLRARIRM